MAGLSTTSGATGSLSPAAIQQLLTLLQSQGNGTNVSPQGGPSPNAATAASGSGGGLTQAQQQQLQQAIQDAITKSGASTTYGAFNNIINNDLTNDGFTPAQIQLAQAGENTADSNDPGGVMEDAKGGNSAAEASSWFNNINQQLSNGGASPGTPSEYQPGTPQNSQLMTLLQSAMQPGYLGNPAQVTPTFYGGTTPYNAPQAAQTPNYSAPVIAQTPNYMAPTIANTPSYNAPTATAAQLGLSNVDPALVAALSPSQTIADLQQSFAPADAQANKALQAQLAQAGIVGGAGVAAQDQLQAQLQAAQDPTLAAAIQSSQSNLLGAANTGSGYQQQTGLNNVNNQLSALQQLYSGNLATNTGNASNLLAALQQQYSGQQSVDTANAGNLLSTLQQQYSGNQTTNLANQSALLSALQQIYSGNQATGLFNAGAANAASSGNAANINTTNAYNTQAYNTNNSAILQALLNAYNAQYGAASNLVSQGLGTQGQIAAAYGGAYQTPSGNGASGASGLAGALGSIYGASGSGSNNSGGGSPNYKTTQAPYIADDPHDTEMSTA